MIRSDSRYADADLIVIDGHPTVDTRSLNRAHRFDYAYYRFKDTDRLDLLADKFLTDSRDWWHVSMANPERLYPVPAAGTQIRIPDASVLRS